MRPPNVSAKTVLGGRTWIAVRPEAARERRNFSAYGVNAARLNFAGYIRGNENGNGAVRGSGVAGQGALVLTAPVAFNKGQESRRHGAALPSPTGIRKS